MPIPIRSLCACVLLFFITSTAFAQIPSPNIQQKPFVPSSRWAMVIGVSSYSDEIGRLKYTAKEARDFAGLLTGELQFDPGNVKILADGGTPDEVPTSARILSSLDSMLADKRLDKANLFIFYFSGHGVGTAKGDFLLPADTKKDRIVEMGVPVREVVGRIVRAGLKNVLFLADACRAGEQNEFGEEFTALCKDANLAVILGCAPGKRSYEYPELKQGAFTHFLIQALQSPELRDASGAVWASRIGASVKKEVFAFTEPDHGKFAQVPALWGDDSTLDVLLAAYPSDSITEATLTDFKTTAKKLTRSEYAAALSTYGMTLVNKGHLAEGVDLLKVVDQLGELDHSSRYALGATLDNLGRLGEANRVYAPLFQLSEGYWRDLALSSSLSRAVEPATRLKAASNLLVNSPDWVVRQLAWLSIERWGAYSDRLRWARTFAQQPATGRKKLYAEAQLAIVEGRWAEAARSLNDALKTPGTEPDDLTLFTETFTPVIAMGDPKELQKYLDRAASFSGNEAVAYLVRAEIAKKNGDLNGRLQNLRKSLKAGLASEQLLLAVKVAGPYLGSLQQEFLDAATLYPYSWRARLVVGFVKQIRGETLAMEEVIRGLRYVDDEISFYSSLYDLLESYLEEAVRLGTATETAYEQQIDMYFLQMQQFAPQFGFDSGLWEQYLRLGLYSERSQQVQIATRKFLPFKPEEVPMNLRPQLMVLEMNLGEEARALALFRHGFEAREGEDAGWLMACFEAARGRTDEAQKRISKLRPPSIELKPRMDALRLYLLAKTGDKSTVRGKLPAAPKDIIVKALTGLTWAHLGSWAKAEPLLAEQANSRIWSYLFLQEFATATLDDHYRKTAKLDKARALAVPAMTRQPGNPLFKHYTFTDKPGLSQFVGSLQMPALLLDDEFVLKSMIERNKVAAVVGDLHLQIDAKGILTGTFKDGEGDVCSLRGQVDPIGNVRGQGKWRNTTFALAAKVAPMKLYKSPLIQNAGQYLELVDQNGHRVAIVGSPSGKLR